MQIKITLNEKQAAVLLKALDLYSRVLIGQTEKVEEVLRDTYWTDSKQMRFSAPQSYVFDAVRRRMYEAKKLLWGLGDEGSFSISNKDVDDKARISYDIFQTVEAFIFKKKYYPQGRCKVEPLSEETLPSIEIV